MLNVVTSHIHAIRIAYPVALSNYHTTRYVSWIKTGNEGVSSPTRIAKRHDLRAPFSSPAPVHLVLLVPHTSSSAPPDLPSSAAPPASFSLFLSVRRVDSRPHPGVIMRWGDGLRRVGVLARKLGMMSLYDSYGAMHPVTVLCVDRCHVTAAMPPLPSDPRCLHRLQVAAGPRRAHDTPKAQRHHYAAAGVEPKQVACEFRVSEVALLPVGTEVTAAHFVTGQLVDVGGTTIGKGFQGTMKRWGFAGGAATHGNSKAHRKPGGIGAGSTVPGRVWPGKKMAGRMGGVGQTVMNLRVFRVDPSRGLIYVRGAVPGYAGGWVRVRDALKGGADRGLGDLGTLPVPTALSVEARGGGGEAEDLPSWSPLPSPVVA